MTRILHRQTGHSYPVAAGAQGVTIRDSAGRDYIDASAGAAVSCLGHAHPDVLAAMHAQLDRLAYAHTSFFTSQAAEELADAAPEGPASNRFEKMINIRDQGQIFRVDVDTIERIDAAGDYMCIQTGDNTLILRETMKDLEKRLDPRRFQRVHRSTIVNLDLVRQVKPHTNGECFLVLDSGAQVKVSRSYRDVVARFVH